MSYCETYDFYEEIHALLKDISDGVDPSPDKERGLTVLLDRWDAISCPDTGCGPGSCPYARPIDWVEYHGYPTLYDLISGLDQSRSIRSIPKASGIDPLDATWAIRPGHYNP
jgi:hypothetical protein